MNRLFDYNNIMRILEDCVNNYAETAPIVAQYADTLYMDMQDDIRTVTLGELITINMLITEDGWMQPNYAQNTVYKSIEAAGRDTTGILSF